MFSSAQLSEIFSAVYETFADTILDDAEVLYVVGLIAQLSPWLLGGKVETWEVRGREFRARYRALVPEGLSRRSLRGVAHTATTSRVRSKFRVDSEMNPNRVNWLRRHLMAGC
jgi:hypothetical protein